MHLRSDSAAGVRFLASMREGRGIKPSARAAGVGKETGYRWLREAYVRLRDQGLTRADAQAELGYCSPLVASWDDQRAARGDGRHHLAVEVAVEAIFWTRFGDGDSLDVARRAAGIGRSTAYRWLQQRFMTLRDEGVSARIATRQLRVSSELASAWEKAQRRDHQTRKTERETAERHAVRQSARHVEALLQPRSRSKAEAREKRYWELMHHGMSNTEVCRMLGMARKTGTRIRARNHHQTVTLAVAETPASGRYLSLRERLQIADLLSLGCSMRQIATEIGRAPSTVKRELDRHRDVQGRYLPRSADLTAAQQRCRPRRHKLVGNPELRKLVQRKLNRCWSPDEISGWLALTYLDDTSMRLCPETIYRALLLPGGRGLHKRYCRKLRTGRRIRKSRWLTRAGHGAAVKHMTMIDKRPAEVELKEQVGNWEGDLIVGVGCVSAMMTLRERKTQFGIIVNLPVDHTAESVNAAAIAAFAPLPAHMKRTLTWDQGTEMARHQELAASTGIDIYFAERCSPWQRGANENFNGLARQYFPKGTDLSVHTVEHVAKVVHELNTRPRKNLGYRTPAELFRAERVSVQP
jgi:transposase, IS30 family